MSRFAWMDDALCAQADPDAWHPDGKGAKYGQAKTVCDRCPVQPQCRIHVQRFEGGHGINERHGLWAAQGPTTRLAAEKEAA
ncbi:WhiB family transcriptional regulator [Streptomyces sp. AC555_RSS877]|uniref:WhiB family transcriptional regulator n=1 Tax=Streptomyces sp. AC555_RSS877 TaxID=2823688 RepID=UPI001C26982A|nr:WhiB family transcriptional regulator [Streptomyces sp. AC555_RSS877]